MNNFTKAFYTTKSKLTILFFFLAFASSWGQQIVGWEMTGLTAYGTSPLAPTAGTLNANITVVGLTRGSGLTTTPTGASNAWGSDGFNTASTTAAAAITANDFWTFSITAKATYKVSLSSISAYNIRRTAAGPTTGLWQYNIGAGFVDIGTAITWGATTSAAGNTQAAITLSGITALQNVAAGTTITFRIVGYGSSGATGTNYFNALNAGDDLVINGTVAAAASAPTLTTPTVSAITTGGATLGATVTSDGGAALSSRGTVWGTATLPTGNVLAEGGTAVSSFSHARTGMGVNTLIYYRGYAINTNGTDYSPEGTFYTKANVASAPTVNNPTLNTLDVAITSGDGNPAITTYAIQETSGSLYVQANGSLGASPVYQTAATWGTKTVTGLSASTAYTFQVIARNGTPTNALPSSTASGTTSTPVSPTANLSGSLTEANLNTGTFTIGLLNDTFTSVGTLTGFTLNNAPAGTTLTSVVSTSTTSATVTLAYDGTDFDTNVTNLNLTIPASALTSNAILTSGNLSVSAYVETITITGNPVTLTAFTNTVVSTQNATEKTYTISASQLIGNLTITAPTGYLVSKTTGSGFASSISYTPDGSGTVASSTVYVRFAPVALGAVGGTISNTSTKAPSGTVTLTNSTGIASATSTVSTIGTGSYTYTSGIAYKDYPTATPLTTGNSVGVMGLTLNDLGGDSLSTTLTAITFTIPAATGTTVARAALFDGSTNLAEVAVSGTTIVFSGLTISATDLATKNFELRATFKTTVTDNYQMTFTVSSVTASAAGSTFAAANGGAATSPTTSSINTVSVVATQLVYTSSAFTTAQTNTNVSSIPVIAARDVNNNVDLDYTFPSLSVTSALTNTYTPSITNGVLTLTNFQFTQTGTGASITVAATSVPTVTSAVMSGITVTLAPVLWNFNLGSLVPTGVPSNLSVSNMSLGNSNGTSGMSGGGTSVSTGYSGASGTYNYQHSVATGTFNSATNAYFEFTLTPDAGYTVTLSSISFGSYNTGTGPSNYEIRSSLAGYATAISGGSGTMLSNSTWVLKSNTLSVQSAPGVPVTFRIYAYGGTGSTGTNWRLDDVNLSLTVALDTNPYLGATPGTLTSFGTVEVGTSTTGTAFTLSGGNLIPAAGNITVTAPTDFEVSNTLVGGYASSVLVPYTGSAVNQLVYVRSKPLTTGAKSDTVTFSGGSVVSNLPTVTVSATAVGSQLSTIAAASFTAPSNVAYGSYQAADITSGNSLEVGQFTIQDGASDNDSFGTILNTVTLSLTNPANIKRVAIYDGSTELQEIAAGATNTFNAPALASNLFTTDGGSKTFSIRVTFNDTVTDNQQYQFTVTGATAVATGSGFATVGGSTSIAGNNNRIVVTANRLTFGTVTGSSFGVPLPSFTITTTDGLGNVDLDRSAAVTLGSTSAFPSANFTRTQPTYALTGGSITISNVAFADGQTGISLTADASGLTQGVSNTFDILLVTWPANSYRTLTAGTWENSGSTSTWERFVSNVWGPSSRPLLATTDFVYITKAITTSASTASNVVIQSGGTLTYGTGTCAGSMLVETGGTLQLNGAMVFTGATVTVESGGTFNVNYATASGITTLWGGTEDFQAGSTVNIQNWNYGAGSGANRLIQNPSIIATNAAGYYFGNLTISGAPSAIFVVVEGGQTNVKICENNFTASNSAQVVAFGNSAGSAIIGGNVVGNSTSSGSFAFSASNGLYTTTINGNLSGSGAINLSTQLGAQTSIVQLKGNLSIPTGASLSVTSDTGTVVFSGTTGTQTLSIAGTLNTRVAFEVGDGTNASEVQLINQNFSLTNALNKLTVNDKGILDFNNRDVTGAGIFALNAGGELKITSAQGINASGNNTGNLQNTGSRTISQSGIFHYVGNVTPQATGTAMTTGSSAKRIIIEKTNATDVVNLTQSTGTTDRLEIIEGTFVETAAANVSGSGELRMSGGTYRTAVAGVSPNFVPQLAGAFTLTGGTIELNAAGNQTLKGARDYRNLTFSTSGTKTLSSAPDSVTGTATIQTGVILNVSNNTFGGPGTNLTMLGTSRYITDGSGAKPDAEGTYDLAATSTIEFANTSGGIIRLGLSPISYGKIEVTGTNVSSTSTTTGILFKSGGSFTVKQGATFTFRQPGGLNGLVNSAVSSTNSPTVTIENTPALSTIVYNGVGQTLTGRADYGNLIINNTSGALTTSGDVTVSGTLTLTKGIVSTGANTIAVTNDTTPISGGSNTAYISGKLRLTYPATGTNVARTFPIGKGSAYRPVTFSYDTAPASRTVLIEQFEAAFPGGVPSSATQFGTRYWNIQQSSTGGSYKVTLDAGGATSSSSIVILRREGASASTSNASDIPNYTNVTSFVTTNVSNDVALGACATCTALSPAFRGITLFDLNTQMSAIAVSGASTYRYEIKNLTTNVTTVFNSSSSSFNLTQMSTGTPAQTVAYATTYAIRVAVNNGGYIFGTSYNVTTIPTVRVTKLTNKQCGTTLPKLDEPIWSDQVYNATKFRFIVNGGSIVNQEIDSWVPFFNLTQLVGTINYGTVYTIRVKASTDRGVTWPTAYGSACTVTTPATPPTSNIISPACGSILASLRTILYAQAVYGATHYRYEVNGGIFASRTFISTIVSPQGELRLTSLVGGAEYSTLYTVRVAISFDNGLTYESYGRPCSFTTPAAPIARMSDSALTNVFEVKAFPNPFARHFSLDIQSSSDDLVNVQVYDMLGRELEVQKATVSELSTKEIGTNYPSGVYNVVVSQGDKVKSVRMIKR